MLNLTVSNPAGEIIYEAPLHKSDTFRQSHSISAPTGSERLLVRTCAPILDLHGYWHPFLSRPRLKLDWRVDFGVAPHINFPFITFFNQHHENCLALGLAGHAEVIELRARQNQSTCSYDLEWEIMPSAERGELQIVVDRTPGPWTEAVRYYHSVARRNLPAFPPAAWEPVYCTWYACHAAVHQDKLEANANLAAALGFRTFILDDGWCFDTDKAVSAETLKTWYAEIGDWEVSRRKFPDFSGHVARVQAMGMKYLLWVAPLMLGIHSKAFAVHRRACFEDEIEGYRMIDPANEAVCADVLRKMGELVADNGLDGLKVDFLDSIPARADVARGEVMLRFMRSLAKTVRAATTESLIEFRQKYANPQVLDCATQFRAGDVPFDFLENLRQIAQVRLCVGDGVPVHADPAFWHPEESDRNVARHLICALAGVPMVSVDLVGLTEDRREMIRLWLAFYHAHIETFRSGTWTVHYQGENLAAIQCRAAGECIVVLLSPCVLEQIREGGGNLWVLNASTDTLLGPFDEVLDCRHRKISDKVVPPAGLGNFRKA